ncbi:MAG: ABC transporter permease subunit [Actinomycetales bacterium]|nr:ABC transporter permease subunit [Actinomycetales bacterium]
MIAVVRSELLKLATVRTPRWVLLAQVLLLAAAASGAVVSGALTPETMATPEGMRLFLAHGGVVAILSLAVGITMSAGEFRHGTAVDTFLTTPRRGRVVAAKLVAGALAGLVAGLVVAVAVLGLALAWFGAKGVDLDAQVVARSLVGVLLWQVLYAVLGVALGAVVRAQAAAITIAVAWLFVAETALSQLVTSVGRWLPATAAAALGYSPGDGYPSQLGGGLVLAAWAVLAGVVAAVVTRRRDLV